MKSQRADRFRRLPKETFDVVIIGAGIGGLTAGGLLAKRGKSVLVVDQHYVPGGNATIFKRPGYEFDIGIHYLGQCGPNGAMPGILRAAGARGVEFAPMDPDGFDTLVFPELTFKVPRGIDAYRDRLVEHFPSERTGIDRYVRLLRQMHALQGIAGNPKSAWRVMPRSLMALYWARSTLGAFFDTCTRDPLLRAVLAGESGDYGQPPSRASLLFHAGLMLHYLESGGYYPKGGGQVMSDALAEAIEDSGGKVLLSTRARRIVVENGRARGVEIENKHIGRRTVRAQTVISNADIKRTLLELLPEEAVSRRTRRRARRWEMSPALGIVYVGARRSDFQIEERSTNYWIYPHTDQEREYATIRAGRVSDEPMVYVSSASLKDPDYPRYAPEGVMNLELMGLAPSSPEAWGVTQADFESGSYSESAAYADAKAAYAERLKRVASGVFPGLSDAIVFEEVATPLTHSRYTLSTGGTSYGLALIPGQFLHRRPGAKTEIEGLLLCGASTRMGHGIMGAMMSGVAAAAALVGGSVFREALGPQPREQRVAPKAPAVRAAAPPPA